VWDLDELYDMQEDPLESNNLIFSKEHQPMVREMNQKLFAMLEKTGGTSIPLYPDRGGVSNLRHADRSGAAEFAPELRRKPAVK
jgi:N-acetylglucosamine-6-sulfatase